MRIFGIGMDIVDVPRIAAAIESHGSRYLAKVFTAAEQAYCERYKNPSIHYAARFAAKEAVAKAFGTGIGQHAAFLEIEVERNDAGAPRIRLHGSALGFAERAGIREIHLSLTHTDACAAASAIAVCDAESTNASLTT